MGLFKFSEKDFASGNTLLDNGEYLAEIENVFEEPKKKAPKPGQPADNTVIDFKILGAVDENGTVSGDFEEFRPIRNWYSANWTIIPLCTTLGVNLAPGVDVELNNDTLKGQKLFLTIKSEVIPGKNPGDPPRTVNKIAGYRPYVP